MSCGHTWPPLRPICFSPGDDDVVWFLPAVKQLVKNFDPELPHAISGVWSLGWGEIWRLGWGLEGVAGEGA